MRSKAAGKDRHEEGAEHLNRYPGRCGRTDVEKGGPRTVRQDKGGGRIDLDSRCPVFVLQHLFRLKIDLKDSPFVSVDR